MKQAQHRPVFLRLFPVRLSGFVKLQSILEPFSLCLWCEPECQFLEVDGLVELASFGMGGSEGVVNPTFVSRCQVVCILGVFNCLSTIPKSTITACGSEPCSVEVRFAILWIKSYDFTVVGKSHAEIALLVRCTSSLHEVRWIRRVKPDRFVEVGNRFVQPAFLLPDAAPVVVEARMSWIEMDRFVQIIQSTIQVTLVLSDSATRGVIDSGGLLANRFGEVFKRTVKQNHVGTSDPNPLVLPPNLVASVVTRFNSKFSATMNRADDIGLVPQFGILSDDDVHRPDSGRGWSGPFGRRREAVPEKRMPPAGFCASHVLHERFGGGILARRPQAG